MQVGTVRWNVNMTSFVFKAPDDPDVSEEEIHTWTQCHTNGRPRRVKARDFVYFRYKHEILFRAPLERVTNLKGEPRKGIVEVGDHEYPPRGWKYDFGDGMYRLHGALRVTGGKQHRMGIRYLDCGELW